MLMALYPKPLMNANKTSYIFHRWGHWVHLPLNTKLIPLLNASVVLFLRGDLP
jgi:hypothetical protein